MLFLAYRWPGRERHSHPMGTRGPSCAWGCDFLLTHLWSVGEHQSEVLSSFLPGHWISQLFLHGDLSWMELSALWVQFWEGLWTRPRWTVPETEDRCLCVAAGLNASLNEPTLAEPGLGLHDSWWRHARGLGCECHLPELCDAGPSIPSSGVGPLQDWEGTDVCARGWRGERSKGIQRHHTHPRDGAWVGNGRRWASRTGLMKLHDPTPPLAAH